ncbi:MAG: [FeFe] hydrogenase H-cluster radical SAM maturase HydG [Fusobacteriaceae bacterium]|nr:[FeFe] hydrogenase H-cluster radical SAM maturase HydG [Fusobacteriaceae bacterium]MBN2837932.1 [FeFe] hydrogenase H-cluster radical SAM maturase HydG [Fusobacteriaceae bacterium]
MQTWKDEVQKESFVNNELIERLLVETKGCSEADFEAVMKKAEKQVRLSLEDVAILLNVEDSEKLNRIFNLAKSIKERVYGNRVVLFAPLYVGNKCINTCTYCGFKATNHDTIRQTLSMEEIKNEVEALVDEGHKRLIMVYGTHPDYNPEYIASSVREAYKFKKGNGEIRRVNINASPLSVEDYKPIKEAGIGTYQIFQETYHEETYKKLHVGGEKSNFKWRLFGLSRAMEAGIDDVGIGALFGLYKWKFEVLGLMSHVEHLETEYGVGPHTISFPRMKDANGTQKDPEYIVGDEELKKIIAILRLAVPYTGLILTAREDAEVRRECMALGVSQIDAGTQIELQGYSNKNKQQDLKKEQFKIGDSRSLDEVLRELVESGYSPSFCTACYRLGRTGEHFMEFSKPGFIHHFCTPNALLTLAEYLEDYAGEETKEAGYNLIWKELDKTEMKEETRETLRLKLVEVKDGKRDLYY